MPTPQRPQKGHYNDAEDEKNLLNGNGTPTENAGNDNGGDGEKVQPSPTTILPTSTDTKENTYSGYDDILAMMQEAQKRTNEDEETARRQERLARAHSFTSGIGDLGRALANMYFTTQYAPNGYDHNKDSLSEKAKARADKWRAERQRLQKEYYNYAMQGANAKNSRDAFKAQQERYAEQLRQSQERIDQARRDYERKLDNEAFNRDYKQMELDMKKAWNEGKLDVARMNAETRRMAEQYKKSRADINHNLASWEETSEDIFDERGKKIGTKKKRIVVNPKTGDLEIKESVTQDNGGGSSQQGGRKANPMGGGQSGTGGKKKNPME